jgi:hypothetical protein
MNSSNTPHHTGNVIAVTASSLTMEVKRLTIAMRRFQHQIVTKNSIIERRLRKPATSYSPTKSSEETNELIIAFTGFYQKLNAIFSDVSKVLDAVTELAEVGNLTSERSQELWEKIQSLEIERKAVMAVYHEGLEGIWKLEEKNAVEKKLERNFVECDAEEQPVCE